MSTITAPMQTNVIPMNFLLSNCKPPQKFFTIYQTMHQQLQCVLSGLKRKLCRCWSEARLVVGKLSAPCDWRGRGKHCVDFLWVCLGDLLCCGWCNVTWPALDRCSHSLAGIFYLFIFFFSYGRMSFHLPCAVLAIPSLFPPSYAPKLFPA